MEVVGEKGGVCAFNFSGQRILFLKGSQERQTQEGKVEKLTRKRVAALWILCWVALVLRGSVLHRVQRVCCLVLTHSSCPPRQFGASVS